MMTVTCCIHYLGFSVIFEHFYFSHINPSYTCRFRQDARKKRMSYLFSTYLTLKYDDWEWTKVIDYSRPISLTLNKIRTSNYNEYLFRFELLNTYDSHYIDLSTSRHATGHEGKPTFRFKHFPHFPTTTFLKEFHWKS